MMGRHGLDLVADLYEYRVNILVVCTVYIRMELTTHCTLLFAGAVMEYRDGPWCSDSGQLPPVLQP